MKRKLLVLMMAVAMLATILPVNTAMVALGEDEEPPITVEAPAAETPEETEPSSDPEDLPEPEVTNEVPEEEPDEEPAEEPKDEDEPDVDNEPTTDEPVVDEPTTDDPEADEPTDDEPVVDEPTTDEEPEEPFKATVVIKLENEGDIYFGDLVTLRAKVEANADYTVVWEYLEENPEDSNEPIWVALDEGDTYKFIVNEENALLTYRAVVNGEVVSEEFVLTEVKAHEDDVVLGDDDDAADDVVPGDDDDTADDVVPGDDDDTADDVVPGDDDDAADDVVPGDDDDDAADDVVPGEDEEPVVDPEELLNPARRIDISTDLKGDLYYGDEVTLIAELYGYENAVYTVQWQSSQDGENWTDVEGATELTYAVVVTEENSQNLWRLIVNVTGVLVDEA